MFGAIGIGALIGALGAKQRGGNLLKGALGGAALGGIGGMLGAKYGTGGGLFGFGKKMLPNALGLGAIGMGTEMLGQQEANQAALAGRRRLMDEEEERRLNRLRQIAGYDIADSKNFLTPQSYFAARGGAIRRKYDMGGDVDNSGIMSVAENKPHPLTAFKDLYDRYITEGVPIAGEQEPLSFKDFFEIIQTKIPKAARGGRVHAASGMYLGDDGMYDKFLDNPMLTKAQRGEMMSNALHDFSIQQMLKDNSMINRESILGEDDYNSMEIDEDARAEYMNEVLKRARSKQPEGRLLQSTIDTTDQNMRMMGDNMPSLMTYRARGGGIADLDMRSGGESIGPGTGTSDDVPAMLSDGEFVVTAKAVENLGGGDRMMGAKRMYQMMNTLDPNSQKPGEMNYVGHG
tara:strand:- start:71 stop:1279 length:1209 start_codon:yes stop_codon:yes gene_type:complete